MGRSSFARSGHLPTLVSAFLYFDISFMVWVLFGPLTPFIAEQSVLSATQKGLLTAVPLLGGSFFVPSSACSPIVWAGASQGLSACALH